MRYYAFLEELIEVGNELHAHFDAITTDTFNILKNINFNHDSVRDIDKIETLGIRIILSKDSFPWNRMVDGHWYYIEKNDDSDIFAEVYSTITSTDHIAIKVSFKKLDLRYKDGKLLCKNVNLDRFDDATESEILNIINPPDINETTIKFVATYNVGQGNSLALCDQNNFPRLYFDFGCGCYWNAHTYSTPINYCYTQEPFFVLSHWDSDHWYEALRCKKVERYKWIVPRQKIGITAWLFVLRLFSYSNLFIWPHTKSSLTTSYGTFFKNTGRSRNDSGISLLVQLPNNSRKKKKGSHFRILLPGDSLYKYIPATYRKKLNGLVASHHGAFNAKDIMPPTASIPHKIIYTYGLGNTHLHPRIQTIMNHDIRGWNYKTALETPYGHCGIFLNSPIIPPCKLKLCDLDIKQV